MRHLTIAITALFVSACTTTNIDEPTNDSTMSKADPYLWLEDVTGEKPLAWVEAQNEMSLGYLQSRTHYQALYDRNLTIYDSDERIVYPSQMGQHIINFWRDKNNKKGLWRRTSISSYLSGNPTWETLLDVDQLAEDEDENWVWKGSNCLRPDYSRCLINLSRGGADAVVVREYDLETKQFVEGGFYLPEAKTNVSWIDKDTLFVGTDFGAESMTDSGYPMISKRWRRGTPLASAQTVFSGEKQDVAVGTYRTWDGDTPHDFIYRGMTFYTRQLQLLRDGKPTLLEVPEDAQISAIHLGQMLIELKSAWSVGGTEYPQGALLSIEFERFLAGERDFQVLVQPTDTGAIDGFMTTKNHIIVNHLDNVTNHLEQMSFDGVRWSGTPIKTDSVGTINLISADEDSDTFFYGYEGFLRPDTLSFVNEQGKQQTVDSLPAFFDANGMKVEQHFATSSDGTNVPYFLVTPAGFKADGKTPTLLYGYGGFEISLTPSYSATVGHSWLEKGGAYVLANIRGGGEFGPDWHQAALKENRQRAFDDFIAIAEDLITRKVTSPEHLGIRGGSNGGLLMGVMQTQRPDLFNAIVCQVPLLDMKRYNKLLAGASWMAEYGDPDTDDWDYISQYSPYQNLQADTDYPKVFFTTSTRDDRVHPAHARKMVARMLEMGHDLLYYENTEGGHAGASDNTQQAKVQALIYSYLWDQLDR